MHCIRSASDDSHKGWGSDGDKSQSHSTVGVVRKIKNQQGVGGGKVRNENIHSHTLGHSHV